MKKPGMIPYYGYEDAHAAMDFLESAFGFEKAAAYDDDDGSLIHGEMRFSDGYIMMGSGRDEQRGDPETVPTRGTYCVVDDVDAHHERAKAAGARIVLGPEDTEFGTRRYRCMDLEGYEWTFGTYVPGQR